MREPNRSRRRSSKPETLAAASPAPEAVSLSPEAVSAPTLREAALAVLDAHGASPAGDGLALADRPEVSAYAEAAGVSVGALLAECAAVEGLSPAEAVGLADPVLSEPAPAPETETASPAPLAPPPIPSPVSPAPSAPETASPVPSPAEAVSPVSPETASPAPTGTISPAALSALAPRLSPATVGGPEAAASPKPRKAHGAPPKGFDPETSKLGVAHYRVLLALSDGKARSRKELVALADVRSGFTSLLGHIDASRAEAQSLRFRGLIVPFGSEPTLWRITPKGLLALASPALAPATYRATAERFAAEALAREAV